MGLLGPIAIIIALLVMASLSQRLGAVTRRAPLYRGYYVAVACIAVGIAWRILGIVAPDQTNAAQRPLFYDFPFAVGLVIAVIIAWRYWSWLFSERGQ